MLLPVQAWNGGSTAFARGVAHLSATSVAGAALYYCVTCARGVCGWVCGASWAPELIRIRLAVQGRMLKMVVALHTAFGVVALLSGAWNLLRPKGTARHPRIGWIYTFSMYLLIFTSFFIFEVFGRFGAFHVLALVSGTTLTLALYFPLRRQTHPAWLEHHYFWISYSYVGLVMATGSHLFDSLPALHYALRILLFWGLPAGVGTALIFGRKRQTIQQVRAP